MERIRAIGRSARFDWLHFLHFGVVSSVRVLIGRSSDVINTIHEALRFSRFRFSQDENHFRYSVYHYQCSVRHNYFRVYFQVIKEPLKKSNNKFLNPAANNMEI